MGDDSVNTVLHADSLCDCLQHGANEDAVDAENRSPLHWAGVCQGTSGKRGCWDPKVGREGRIMFGREGQARVDCSKGWRGSCIMV